MLSLLQRESAAAVRFTLEPTSWVQYGSGTTPDAKLRFRTCSRWHGTLNAHFRFLWLHPCNDSCWTHRFPIGVSVSAVSARYRLAQHTHHWGSLRCSVFEHRECTSQAPPLTCKCRATDLPMGVRLLSAFWMLKLLLTLLQVAVSADGNSGDQCAANKQISVSSDLFQSCIQLFTRTQSPPLVVK